MSQPSITERRAFFANIARLGSGLFVSAPALTEAVQTDSSRPGLPSGIASGDVAADGAILWARADRPARMLIEVADNRSFENSRRLFGPHVLASSDFTGKFRLRGCAAGQRIHYRIRFQDLDGRRRMGPPVEGQFQTSPEQPQDITFLWSGDTAGQGYGIDPDRGGMLSYETMRQHQPDFFVHSGDACYADNPFPSEITLDDGSRWSNLVTEATSKVAETIDEFRGNYRYNLMDENVRRFNAEVPLLAQWDDHETTNNWYPGELLSGDDRYSVKSVSLLAARAKQAFLEYTPIRSIADGPTRIQRKIAYGPTLDLFFLDLRSFRGPNSRNDQTESSRATAFLGTRQLEWLKKQLSESKATWKVICSDMPLGLIVRDGDHFENSSNGDGPPRGREFEVASLLSYIKKQAIRNTVWLTADVHYAASHYYDPNAARFQDFDPFWEFVSGPLHAGTFGPGQLDKTFGPQERFCSIPKEMKPNRPPSDGLQFFGRVQIDADSQVMNVGHFNRAGDKLWEIELPPQA